MQAVSWWLHLRTNEQNASVLLLGIVLAKLASLESSIRVDSIRSVLIVCA